MQKLEKVCKNWRKHVKNERSMQQLEIGSKNSRKYVKLKLNAKTGESKTAKKVGKNAQSV